MINAYLPSIFRYYLCDMRKIVSIKKAPQRAGLRVCGETETRTRASLLDDDGLAIRCITPLPPLL